MYIVFSLTLFMYLCLLRKLNFNADYPPSYENDVGRKKKAIMYFSILWLLLSINEYSGKPVPVFIKRQKEAVINGVTKTLTALLKALSSTSQSTLVESLHIHETCYQWEANNGSWLQWTTIMIWFVSYESKREGQAPGWTLKCQSIKGLASVWKIWIISRKEERGGGRKEDIMIDIFNTIALTQKNVMKLFVNVHGEGRYLRNLNVNNGKSSDP